MGLFDGQSTPVEDIQTGYNVPAGEYEFEITDVELKHFDENHAKIPNQSALVVELTVVNECPQEGMSYDQFLILPNDEQQEPKRVRQCNTFLKQSLGWFGIPESRMNSWNPETEADMIVGKRGMGVLKATGAYTNLTSFELTDEAGVSNTEVSATAGASLSDWA